MTSPNYKQTQGPEMDAKGVGEISLPGPDSLPSCLLGRKRGAGAGTSPSWSLWGEGSEVARARYRGAGVGHQGPLLNSTFAGDLGQASSVFLKG